MGMIIMSNQKKGIVFISINSTEVSNINYVVERYSGNRFVIQNGASVFSDNFETDSGISLYGAKGNFTNLISSYLWVSGGGEVYVDQANLSNYTGNSVINVWNDSFLSLSSSNISTVGRDDAVAIFNNSSAIFDQVDITGDAILTTGIVVFNDSSLEIKDSSIVDQQDGFLLFLIIAGL